ncbi:MAG TPA: 4'-phosphopantetheinyl transferase superfamily protein [Candidatus Acidoferrales bacterium]
MNCAQALRRSALPLTLEENTVHAWSADLDRSPYEIRRLHDTLSPDERERAFRFRFAGDQQRFIASRGILRDILARYVGRPPDALHFSYGPFGKPSLADDCASDLRFNLSHSGNVALYAVTHNREVGVDVERIDSSFVDDGIEEKFFSDNEIAKLRSLHTSERPRAFFNCWTRKEAYVKACGGGLQISLQSFEVSLAPHEAVEFLSTGESGWSLLALPLGRDYAAAVAVEGNNCELKSWHWLMQPTQ